MVVRGEDKTSADIPLLLELEKTMWTGTDVRLWGTVRNRGATSFRFVRVILTARDSRGQFIGRNTWFAQPSAVGPGQVGYIEGVFVECEGRRPAVIEFSVVGERAS
jgi:hypothetical protein